SAAGQPASLATAWVNLAAVAIVSNDLPVALAYYARAEPALRDLDQHTVLVPLYNNRAQVREATGDVPGAIADLQAGGRSAAVVGALAQSLAMSTRAVQLLYATGRQAESEPLLEQVADVARALGDRAALQRALGDRALLVMARGDVAAAARLLDEQEAICTATGDAAGLAAAVGNRAILQRTLGDLPGALASIERQLEIARASGNGQAYLFATANRGELLGAMGRVGEGLAALAEARAMAVANGLTPMVEELDRMAAAIRATQQ
ncbi:MAG TPA: hypothetical protein PLV68_19085, partial [Ilumatobacteraceae bacterium]|nr:hypothetical protein [Ilumatobacteraceae bacterium]